jgi:hypothetical protein
MSLLEAKIPFLHQIWQESETRDSHGNKTGTYSNSIPRMAVSLYPANSTLNKGDMVNPNVVVRNETDIMLFVDDASLFGAQDLVIFEGLKFKVQGQPQFGTWDYMPIDGYADLVPEQLHIKRVT